MTEETANRGRFVPSRPCHEGQSDPIQVDSDRGSTDAFLSEAGSVERGIGPGREVNLFEADAIPEEFNLTDRPGTVINDHHAGGEPHWARGAALPQTHPKPSSPTHWGDSLRG